MLCSSLGFKRITIAYTKTERRRHNYWYKDTPDQELAWNKFTYNLLLPFVKHLYFFNFRTLLLVLNMIVEYCHCVDLMPMLAADIMTKLFELMKV